MNRFQPYNPQQQQQQQSLVPPPFDVRAVLNQIQTDSPWLPSLMSVMARIREVEEKIETLQSELNRSQTLINLVVLGLQVDQSKQQQQQQQLHQPSSKLSMDAIESMLMRLTGVSNQTQWLETLEAAETYKRNLEAGVFCAHARQQRVVPRPIELPPPSAVQSDDPVDAYTPSDPSY